MSLAGQLIRALRKGRRNRLRRRQINAELAAGDSKMPRPPGGGRGTS